MTNTLYTRLADLALWWIHPRQRRFWFSGMAPTTHGTVSLADQTVFEKCQDLGITLTDILTLEPPFSQSGHLGPPHNSKSTTDRYDRTFGLGYIVAMDQIARHLLRYHSATDSNNTIADPALFATLSSRVVEWCTNQQLYNLDTLQCFFHEFGPTAVVFLVMPLRHIRNNRLASRVQYERCALVFATWLVALVRKYSDTSGCNGHTSVVTMASNSGAIVKSFYRATLHQFCNSYSMQVHTRLECCIHSGSPNVIDPHVLDMEWCKHYNPEKPFQLFTQLMTNKFWRPLIDMLDQHPEKEHLIISVSGGVDSMTLLIAAITAVSYMWKHPKWHGTGSSRYLLRRRIALSVVHINYGNRDTADAEEELVRRFVHEINTMQHRNPYLADLPPGFNIQQVVAWPREIIGKKNQAPYRDLYESVTRGIRFDTYKEAAARYCSHTDTYEETAVLLGHNGNDVLENYLTNLADCKYGNLAGMRHQGVELGVTIWRPFLDIPKPEIYEEAARLDIPHVYDSTPKTCNRGKLRDQVIPVILKHLPGFMTGVLGIIQYSEAQTASYQREVQAAVRHRYMSIHKIPRTHPDNDDIPAISYMLDLPAIISMASPSYDKGENFFHDVLLYIAKQEGLPYPGQRASSNAFRQIMYAYHTKCESTLTSFINQQFTLEITCPYKLFAIFWPQKPPSSSS